MTLLDKRVFKAKVIGRDPTTDIAVIKIDGTGFPTINLGNDENSRVGEWVLAIGNPLGLDFTVTAGIISAKGRSGQLRNLYASQYAIVDYIQTDAAINPGNSGGPLVNSHGDVIGVNSAIASGTGYYSGYGFAIPISLAKTVMNDLIQYGRVRRAILGVSISDLRPEDAQAAGLKEIRGALVGGGTPGQASPAEKAGIEPGDVIVAIDGTTGGPRGAAAADHPGAQAGRDGERGRDALRPEALVQGEARRGAERVAAGERGRRRQWRPTARQPEAGELRQARDLGGADDRRPREPRGGVGRAARAGGDERRCARAVVPEAASRNRT